MLQIQVNDLEAVKFLCKIFKVKRTQIKFW